MILTKILSRLSQSGRGNVDYESIVPLVPFSPGIPKWIMQTCRSGNDLPEEILSNIRCLKTNNPDWTYLLYDDVMIVEYIRSNYGSKVLAYYNRIAPEYGAAKADLFRYLYIYREGGVYLDIKSTIIKPLSETIRSDDSFLFSFWDNQEGEPHYGVGHYSDVFKDYPRGEIPQWFIVSAKGHPIIRDIIIKVLSNIDAYNPYVNGVGWTGTVFTTGPVPYSLTIYQNLKKYPYRSVNAFTELGLVYSIYESKQVDSTYHAKAIKSDYRKGRMPVVRHKSIFVESINECYLKAVGLYKASKSNG